MPDLESFSSAAREKARFLLDVTLDILDQHPTADEREALEVGIETGIAAALVVIDEQDRSA